MINLDLNLLNVFDTLYELRSVTKTAARLNLTQSAISHALRRLREAVGDPLFVRAAGRLQPTARAAEIAPGVRAGLSQLRGAMAPTLFEPDSSTRAFTVAAGSYFCALMIPELIARARVVAPGVSIRIASVGTGLLADLDESIVDLALGAFARVPARLVAQPLFREEMVWIAAADNPVARGPVTRAQLEALPRLAIDTTRPFEPSKALFAEGGLEPRVVGEVAAAVAPELVGEVPTTVYDTLTAMAVVERTDMIALVPRRIARIGIATGRVVALAAEGDREGIDIMMLWHGKFGSDAGLAWLRSHVLEVSQAEGG
jgi:DNA-binding transcriptional LysR family regulator